MQSEREGKIMADERRRRRRRRRQYGAVLQAGRKRERERERNGRRTRDVEGERERKGLLRRWMGGGKYSPRVFLNYRASIPGKMLLNQPSARLSLSLTAFHLSSLPPLPPLLFPPRVLYPSLFISCLFALLISR